MDSIQQRIEKLTEQLAKTKAQQMMREQAARNRLLLKQRRERSRRLFKLGGLVDRCDLGQIDDTLLLGMLTFCRETLVAKDQIVLGEFRERGSKYLNQIESISDLRAVGSYSSGLDDTGESQTLNQNGEIYDQ